MCICRLHRAALGQSQRHFTPYQRLLDELRCHVVVVASSRVAQAPACEHAFCRGCITEWLSRQQICPVDRQTITAPQLKPVPRILRNLLARYRRSARGLSLGELDWLLVVRDFGCFRAWFGGGHGSCFDVCFVHGCQKHTNGPHFIVSSVV